MKIFNIGSKAFPIVEQSDIELHIVNYR